MHRIRRQQILREVEGYLELLTACEEQWSTTPEVRDQLATRAIEKLDSIGPRGGSQSRVLFLKGYALRVMERYADAVEPLHLAAELDPGNLEIWLMLGWCYKRCGQIELAIRSLEEAVDVVDGSEAIVFYNLACYFSLAKNVRLALRNLSRAFDIDPNFRDLVDDEPDFDPIRRHPEFRAIMSVIV